MTEVNIKIHEDIVNLLDRLELEYGPEEDNHITYLKSAVTVHEGLHYLTINDYNCKAVVSILLSCVYALDGCLSEMERLSEALDRAEAMMEAVKNKEQSLYAARTADKIPS